VQIEILDAAGKSVKKFSSKPPEGGVTQAGTPGDEEGGGRFSPAPARVPVEKGLNRFVWGLRYPDAARVSGMILWAGTTSGPRAVPGTYQVKLTLDGKTMTEPFEVRKDPRISTTQEEFQKQFDLLMKIRDKLTETHNAIIEIRDVRKQVDDYSKRI